VVAFELPLSVYEWRFRRVSEVSDETSILRANDRAGNHDRSSVAGARFSRRPGPDSCGEEVDSAPDTGRTAGPSRHMEFCDHHTLGASQRAGGKTSAHRRRGG